MGRSFRQSRDEGEGMRAIQEPFVRLGEIAIEDIAIDPVCRDDIPAVLRGIQHLYCDEALRRQVFDLLDAHFLPGVDRGLGPCNTPLMYMDFRSGLFLSVLDR